MSKTRSGRSPVRGWLEPKKISANAAVKPQLSEAHPAKSKPIARVQPVCSTVPRKNVVTGHQSPHVNADATNIHFLTSTTKPIPHRDYYQRTPNDLPRKSQSHKTPKPVAPSKNSNVVKIVNVNVINVNTNNLAKLKLSNESSSSVGCSSGNDVKHKPKTVRAQPQSCQSVPRNTPKSAKTGNKKNESSSRRQVVVVTQKQSTVCKIVTK